MNDSLEIDETAKYIEKFINDTTEKAKDDPNLMSMEFMNLIFDLRYKLYELSLISGTKYDLAINEKEFIDRLGKILDLGIMPAEILRDVENRKYLFNDPVTLKH